MTTLLTSRPPRTRMTLFFIFFIAFTYLPALSSAKPQEVTESELKLLPRYCLDTMWFPERYDAKSMYWVNVMGKSFSATHHYCWGLTNLNRARKANAKHRTGLLEDVLNDFRYVTQYAPSDFVMLPEIYTKIGEVELLIKNPDKANGAFAKARSLKPDYWPAYSHWIEFLMQTGKRAEAREIARSGLQHSPDAKVLREQYRLLGGSPADIPELKETRTPLSETSPDTNHIKQ